MNLFLLPIGIASAGTMIIGFTHLGVPVSTTHSIAGSIVGVGSTRGLSAVRWGLSARIVWAWVLTIPSSAGLAIISFWLCGWVGSLYARIF